MGAGIAAAGFAAVNWQTMSKIAASWVISPVLGGIIAAGTLYFIKRTVLYQTDMRSAAIRIVPMLVAIMGWAFSTYLILKGIKKLIKIEFPMAVAIGLGVAVIVYLVTRPMVTRAAARMKNVEIGIDRLFLIPLIVAATLLSFAHGANDVANAVGPLAAINEAVISGGVTAKAGIPIWVMLIGALGIAAGLALYGPKLIKTVGTEITELDMARAFCVALAAAVTVIIASQLGLPVSSTHITVGGIFGVGFLREYLESDYNTRVALIEQRRDNGDDYVTDAFVAEFDAGSMVQKKAMLREMKAKAVEQKMSWAQRRDFKKAYKAKLVERRLLLKIVAAWIFTVPLTGLLAAAVFFMIRGIMVVV